MEPPFERRSRPTENMVAYTAIENGRVVLFRRTLDQAVPTRLPVL